MNIPDGFREAETVYHWMNEHFGMQEEGKTWFWSTENYKDTDCYGNECWRSRSGVEIWTDDPHAIVFAMIKWPF
jgi:hypothetical protein